MSDDKLCTVAIWACLVVGVGLVAVSVLNLLWR